MADWIGERKIGYTVCAFFSPENQRRIAKLQAELHRALPGVLWTASDVTQHHLTLFEIVMTYRDYPQDRETIFKDHEVAIDAELTAQLAHQGPVPVSLDTLEVSPSAIIVRGTDDGSFQRLRDVVSGKHLLPEGTRTPPDVIHSSLIRYVKEIDAEQVRSVVAGHQLKLTEVVTQFEMVQVWRMPMDYTTLKTYKLLG